MPDVSGNTILMAIQAVDDALNQVRQRLRDADEDDDNGDDQELLSAYKAAALELQRSYEVARLSESNLPPYSDLVPPRG